MSTSAAIVLEASRAFAIERHETVESWLEARRKGIGASEAGAMWGCSPFSSQFSVWTEKVHGVAPDIDPEAAMVGEELEPAAARIYGRLTGRGVYDLGRRTILRSTKYDFLFATLDRVLEAADMDGPGVLECKARGLYALKEWREDLPADVWAQVQHQLAVTDWKWAAVSALIGGRPFRCEVARDDEFIAGHVEACEAFWKKHVFGNVAPEIDGSGATGRALRGLYPGENGETIELGAEAEEWVTAMKAARERRGQAEKEVDDLENRLRAAVGAASAARLPSGALLKLALVKGGPVSYVRKDYRKLTISMPKIAKGAK